MQSRRAVVLIFLVVALPWCVRAQTTVTGTVVDPNGNPYANGTASAFKVVPTGQNPGTPTNVSTTTAGSFSMSLPSPATYQFTICAPPVNIGPRSNPTPTQVCLGSGPISISGGGPVDISGSLPAIPILGPSSGGTSIPSVTVATLPASPPAGSLAIVTDGNGVSCTSGGLTTVVLCRFSGSSWAVVSGGSPQSQFASDTAFPGGVIPRNFAGTIVLQNTPTAFTLNGAACSGAPVQTCDGKRITFFQFQAGGPYTITGDTPGLAFFNVPFFGPADTITFSQREGGVIFEYRNGTLHYVGGGGFSPAFNGSSGPIVSSAISDAYRTVTSNQSLDFPSPPVGPFGSAFITKGSAAILTLSNPTAGGDDGKTLTVFSTTAFAHTITTGANGINGSLHIATFGAAIGNFIVLKAFNGSWWVVGNTGVVLT